MNNWQGVILPFLFIGSAGSLVLFIVAVVQENRSEHRGGFRLAFYTIVSLVMLTMTVGATVALLNTGFRQYIFKSADLYQQRYSGPPQLYLPSQGAIALPLKEGTSVAAPGPTTTLPSVYQCSKDCQFTAYDKTQVGLWVTNYKQWQKQQGLSLATRRSLATSLGFFIIGLPLYLVFSRLMRKGRRADGNKPSPLNSLYFYGVAFAGLVMAVVASGVIINDGLQVWLKTGSDTSVPIVQPAIDGPTSSDYGVKSLLACKDKCGFSAEEVSLANQWVADNAKYQDAQTTNTGQYSAELATTIPFVLVGLPLFLYHFTSIRKESSEPKPNSPASIS